MNYDCFIFWDLRNLQEQVKKAFCYQRLFGPFTVWINCSNDLKMFEKNQPSASNFKRCSRPLEQFFLTVGQYNFGSKIPFFFLLCHSQHFMKRIIFWKTVHLKNLLTESCHFGGRLRFSRCEHFNIQWCPDEGRSSIFL